MRYASLLLAAALAHAADPPRKSAGNYQVTLRLPPDGLFAQEENQIEFRIQDLSRPDPLTGYTPVVRAVPQAVIDMPAMPRMPAFTEIAHAEPVPGDYGIHPTFAHGGDYRLRITVGPNGTVEFPLAVDDAGAKRRKPVPPRFTLELSTKKIPLNQPADLSFTIRDRDNANSVVTSFETVHERLVHLVIVRRDLTQFAHEHPTLNPDGTFTLRYTFPAPGEYHLFADATPQSAGSQILFSKLTVPGKPQPVRSTARAVAQTYPSKKTIPVTLPIDDPPTALEPYLGAIGHLLLIHEDSVTFVHAHPDDSGQLQFLTRFPKPGAYRAWLQYQTKGQLRTLEFQLHAD